jgi:hypothetical protein
LFNSRSDKVEGLLQGPIIIGVSSKGSLNDSIIQRYCGLLSISEPGIQIFSLKGLIVPVCADRPENRGVGKKRGGEKPPPPGR